MGSAFEELTAKEEFKQSKFARRRELIFVALLDVNRALFSVILSVLGVPFCLFGVAGASVLVTAPFVLSNCGLAPTRHTPNRTGLPRFTLSP